MAEDPRTTNPEAHRGSYGYGGPGGYGGGGGAHGQPQGAATPAASRRTSWGAIIAGTVVALVVYLMLGLLGIGIGATQVDIGDGIAAAEGLAIGAAVWWVITILVSLFIGGWFAGYLSGIPEKRDGAIHGIVTWGLAILLTAWFATTAVGAVTAGAWNVLEGGMAALNGEQIEMPAQAQQAQNGEDVAAEAQEQIEAVADDVTEAVAHAGIWGFVALLLGAIVAAVGGLVGAIQTRSHTYFAYPGGERREEPRREPEREREHEPGRYDYERAERERADRERAERERREREAPVGREGYEHERERTEREPGERERLERERAERERQQRDQP